MQPIEYQEKGLPLCRYTLTFWDYELGCYVEWHSYRSARRALAVAARFIRIHYATKPEDIFYADEDVRTSLRTPSPANNEFIYVGYQQFACVDVQDNFKKFYKTFLLWRMVRTYL